MKRLIKFAAFAVAAILSAVSCGSDSTRPTVEFAEKILSITVGGEVEVSAVLDKAAENEIRVPVEFSGSAEKGRSYTVSSEYFSFDKGSKKASITVTDLDMVSDGDSRIVMKLTGNEAVIGTNFTCVVTLDTDEELIYNFNATKAEVAEVSSFTLSLTGVESGDRFKAPSDMEIPLKIEGDAERFIDYPSSVTVSKGTSSARFEIRAREASKTDGDDLLAEQPENLHAVMSVDGGRFIGGDRSEVSLKVLTGQQTAEIFLGAWEFDRIYDLKEMEEWFEMEGDDPSLLPTANEGFRLYFELDEETADVVLATNRDKGGFADFFRNGAVVTLTEPINYSTEAEPAGRYAMKESNMFMAEETDAWVVWHYYRLSTANRAFSSEKETAGEAVIAMRINDNGCLEMQFRDYDTPPFGGNWWDPERFDADMFAFCCRFNPVDR